MDGLKAVARPVSVAAGTVLFRIGECASTVYLVRRGRLALIWAAAGNIFPMQTVEAGDIVGLPAAFNGTYSVTARAVEDCELAALLIDDLMHLLDCDPALLQAATALLAHQVARMRSLLVSISAEAP